MKPHMVMPILVAAAALSGTAAAAPSGTAAASAMTAPTGDTVRVAPPTGDNATDRASILAALEQARSGSTVQFAAGTYIVGEMIRVTTSGITLLAHPEGTTLQGCREGLIDRDRDQDRCNGLELAGGRQTVRGFTIQDVFWGIHLGCCWAEKTTYTLPDGSTLDAPAFYRTEGGHLVEGNTIVRAASGVRVNGDWSEPAVVRGNRFVDNWHAVSINGHTVHLLDNEITVHEPERVPFYGFPWDGVKLSPTPPLQGVAEQERSACVGNVVAGNRIEGHLDGIRIELYFPGTRCTGNIVRDNTITVRRVKNPRPGDGFTLVDESDSTFVGVPIALLNEPVAFGEAEADGETAIEGNVIEGNRILGGEGVGIQVLHASRNRIAGNSVQAITVRDPFPGNNMGRRGVDGAPLPWEAGNGAGIWISAGSEGNLVAGNVFEGIAGASVVREGELETDDGVRLYYRMEGEGPDTVVVVHGGPSLGHAYLAPDLLQLARGRVVVHYDQRGIGRSTPLTDPERLSVERHVQDLEALRAHLGVERLALLGHSWGAMLAARYAAAHPQHVERMLLLDPMAPARDPFMALARARAGELMNARLDATARARLDSLSGVTEIADPLSHCRAAYSLLRAAFFHNDAAGTRSRAEFCAGTPETLRNRGAVDAAIFGSLAAWDVRPLLAHVRSPVLVVHGAAGAIPRQAMDAWVESFPDARMFSIERAGHYPHVDRPDAFFPAADSFFAGAWPATGEPGDSLDAVTSDTVRVAPPRGETTADRTSILEALGRVRPGGTVQFAPGTYLVGELIRVSTPRIKLLGHPEGTVLRGCDEDAYEAMEWASSAAGGDRSARAAIVSRCGTFELTGGHVTVRGLTFEGTRMGLMLGCCHGVAPGAVSVTPGGYVIEHNTFRNSGNGIRPGLLSAEPTVIRSNRFINTFHAVSAAGGHLYLLDNDVSAPEPERVPGMRHPSFAIALCGEHNVVSGNRLSGHPDGILLVADPGFDCRHNVIRDNTIAVSRVRVPASRPYAEVMPLSDESDSTYVGVPLMMAAFGEAGAVVEDNVIEANHFLGAEGVAIELSAGMRNRIVGNTFSAIRVRAPFPGNTLGGPPAWETANGSAIWVARGSVENEIAGNTFEGVASHVVVLEGDRNRVELRTPADSVQDLGSGNEVGIRTETHGTRALREVDVVDVERGQVIPRQTVLITDGRISAVGPATEVPIPAGADVVEARGTFLIPGLWDMHVHSSSDAITRTTMLPMYVANGVTGVRDMHADCFEPCAADRSTIAQVKGWRADIAAGRLVGPRIVAASQELNGPPPDEPSSVHMPATAEEGRAVVRLLQQRGVDFIKTYDMLPRDAYFGLAGEARRLGMQFAGHVPVEVRASEASDAGQKSMEHLVGILEACSGREDELRRQVILQLKSDTPRVLSTVLRMADSFSEERCAALFATFVANGTWHVPTLLVHDKAARMNWQDDPRTRFVRTEEQDVWEELQKYEVETLWGSDPEGFARLHRVMSDVVLAMHRAGVRILAGSDAAWVGAFPGFSLHDELELLVGAGLTPADALRAATLGPALYLEATDSLGTIAPGRLADLVLLDANPLDDIRNTRRIRAVISDGRFFDRHALDRLLADVEAAAGGADVVQETVTGSSGNL